MTTTLKPALVTIPRTQPWWEAVERGTLMLQRCRECSAFQLYPRVLCTRCWSEQLEWRNSAGTGSIWSFTVAHVPGHHAWTRDVPYVLAVVQLDEGPRMMSRIVDAEPGVVRVAQRVSVRFRALGFGEPILPVFVIDSGDIDDDRR